MSSPSLIPLDSLLYQDMRWCANCGGRKIFVPCYECDFGIVGYCDGCGEERVLQFTRTISQVA